MSPSMFTKHFEALDLQYDLQSDITISETMANERCEMKHIFCSIICLYFFSNSHTRRLSITPRVSIHIMKVLYMFRPS